MADTTKKEIIKRIAEQGGSMSFVERDGKIEDVHISCELLSPDTDGSSLLIIEGQDG